MTDAEKLVAAVLANTGIDPDEPLWETFGGAHDEVHTWQVKTMRWGRRIATAYRLPDGTFAAIEANIGGTERVELPPDLDAYVVEAYEKTVTRYRKVV